jgi:hypothetical protein
MEAGHRFSYIRHACMGIGLLAGVPELARIPDCKRNYVEEPGKCMLDARSSSGNLWLAWLSPWGPRQ